MQFLSIIILSLLSYSCAIYDFIQSDDEHTEITLENGISAQVSKDTGLNKEDITHTKVQSAQREIADKTFLVLFAALCEIKKRWKEHLNLWKARCRKNSL